MATTTFVPKKFNADHSRIIKHANAFLEAFYNAGYQVTLRTLYYKFVKSNLIPNTVAEYKRLSKIMGDARLAGLVDWDYMEDRMRSLDTLQHHRTAQASIDQMARTYHIDLWRNQKWRPEVWIEKDALSGIIRGVCEENDVPFFCCRGYTSLTEMYRASMRLRGWAEGGQKPYIIHFGDHDPSGIDMSRDIEERLTRTFGATMDFARIALSMSQIEANGYPPNPAKESDSRFKEYQERFGDDSWELDAMEPDDIKALIQTNIDLIKDEAQWKLAVAEKEKTRKQLAEVAKEWYTIPVQKKRVKELEASVEEQVKINQQRGAALQCAQERALAAVERAERAEAELKALKAKKKPKGG